MKHQNARFLERNDPNCETTNWDWTGVKGLIMKRDCRGACFDDYPGLIGDYVCDNGATLQGLTFTCPQFEYDLGDCKEVPSGVFTTPKPANPCFETCPSGDWKRRDCSQCAVEKNGMCVQEQDPKC